MDKPNVVLLTIDTLRADRLGCYGYERPLTPNFDRLAARGVRFAEAITGGSWTQAAFPVMMTSTYASMYGGCLGALAAERPSPIQLLNDSGYATGGFSSSPLLSRAYAYHRGFQHFADLTPKETDPVLRKMKGGQRLLRTPITHAISRLLGQQTRPARIYVNAEEITNAAQEWIAGVNQPFFAWLHYMDVHWPYHREETLTDPQEIAQAWRDLAHLYDVNWNGAPVSEAQRTHYIRLYEEALTYTDAQVGKLLDYLETAGLMDNSIIVVVSDHGEEFLEHGRWGHWETNLHDEILKVPLIICPPDRENGRVVEQQVRLLDLMPTLLALTNCPIPDGLEGVNLGPLWQADGTAVAEPVSVSEMWRDERHIIAIRTRQYKYIWDSKQPDRPLLFDLTVDPGEKTNIAADCPALTAEFYAYVTARLQAMNETRPDHASAGPDVDEEMLARLRGLGYIE